MKPKSAKLNITGIILAGGKSRRMGMDKGLILYKGKPMISYSIDLLAKFCGRVLLSSSSNIYDSFGLERVPDLIENAGPMAGLLSCLKKSNTEINLCLPCDTPEMTEDIVSHLIDVANENPGKCIVPLTPLAEPLTGIYPLSVIPVLESLLNNNDHRMTSIFSHFPVKYVPMDEFQANYNKDIFKNINSANDLQ